MQDNLYNEKICVLIPAYNMGKYLERCIDSVLAQTYQNIRVLVVDDGSTDNTREICERYKEKDSRFTSLHIENSGHGIARNIGIDHCTEKYIAMIDSDDCINTTFIEALYDVMIKSNADIVCPSYVSFHEDHEIDWNMNVDASADEYIAYTRDEAMEELSMRYSRYFVMPQKLYKTALFKDYRYTDEPVNVDEWAIHHLIIRSESVAISKKAIYFWRQSPEGMTRNFSAKKISGVRARIDRLETAKKHGYTSCIPSLERGLHFQAIMFYRRCRSNHINGKELLKPYEDRLKSCFPLGAEQYKDVLDRKERFLHWLFVRNYLLFDYFDGIIKDTTNY